MAHNEDDNRRRRRERIQGIRDAMGEAMGVEMGKLPPQAVDLEEVVLGALMLEKDSIQAVGFLTPEFFYNEAHHKIFTAITDLYRQGKPVDILTVTHALRATGELESVGGPLYISQMTSKVASSANIETHARIIQEKYLGREIIRLSNQAIRMAYDETEDVFDVAANLGESLISMNMDVVKNEPQHVSQVTNKASTSIETRETSINGVTGVPSGLVTLDRFTGGWQKSDLIYIAGRPGQGKTALMLTCALEQAKMGIPTAVFSLEMGGVQLVYRLLSQMTGISSSDLAKKVLDKEQKQLYYMAKDQLDKLPLYIDETAGLSVYDLRTKTKKLRQKKGIESIFVDYIQLMSIGLSASKQMNQKGNREQEISTISRGLKLIAKEEDIPVIAGSQLSRKVEERKPPLPILSDLRESGTLEQDADIVAFLYRPEYYGIKGANGEDLQGLANVIIAKHRNGAVGDVDLKFIAYQTRFTDPDNTFGGATASTISNWKPTKPQVEHSDKRAEGLPRNEQFLSNTFDDDEPF